MKKCVVHIPNKLNPSMASASQIRPLKMVDAFRGLGYEVDVVEGYAAERKQLIKEIKKNIKNDVKYDFMYAESSTMPTLLTDPTHLPLHPLVDFEFFKFAKAHNIKIGLFYRDMYWKFPIYKQNVHGIKADLAIKMYKYDLKKYNLYLDKLYIPLTQGFKYLEKEINPNLLDLLPPGCELSESDNSIRNDAAHIFTLLYVGGLGDQYQIDTVLKVVSIMPAVRLILCCRENEWNAERGRLKKYLTDNIIVEHKTAEELETLYRQADIGILFLKPDIYREIAMPYKTFEYMGHGLPMIASQGTGAGAFVKKENVGWTIPYDENELASMLKRLSEDHKMVSDCAETVQGKAKKHTWSSRALKVIEDLTE